MTRLYDFTELQLIIKSCKSKNDLFNCMEAIKTIMFDYSLDQIKWLKTLFNFQNNLLRTKNER
mgnify:CR=1 FL=1|tara:strand:- start:57956 stop:58144 length:189 start_codon:yes stop_codon:yes gene_type:complete